MFTVTANPIAPVSGSGDSTTFEVTFAPTTAGAKTAILHIASNDADENPFDINLSGIGVPVTPRQMFDSWAATANLAGANAEPFATPHHDGVINLLKYAFSMSGNAPDVEVLAPGVGTVACPASPSTAVVRPPCSVSSICAARTAGCPTSRASRPISPTGSH